MAALKSQPNLLGLLQREHSTPECTRAILRLLKHAQSSLASVLSCTFSFEQLGAAIRGLARQSDAALISPEDLVSLVEFVAHVVHEGCSESRGDLPASHPPESPFDCAIPALRALDELSACAGALHEAKLVPLRKRLMDLVLMIALTARSELRWRGDYRWHCPLSFCRECVEALAVLVTAFETHSGTKAYLLQPRGFEACCAIVSNHLMVLGHLFVLARPIEKHPVDQGIESLTEDFDNKYEAMQKQQQVSRPALLALLVGEIARVLKNANLLL